MSVVLLNESIFHKIYLKETGNSFLRLFQLQIIVGNAIASFYSLVIFDNVEKSTIDWVLDVCSCLEYESIFHRIHLKETGNSF